MKKILITGGSGFIGSHLCEELLNRNNAVICLDNFFTGPKSNVTHLLSNHNFNLIEHDVTIPYIDEIDEIYNLACPASPIYYQSGPIKTTQTSVIGALNMLELAKIKDAKILQASTSEIYGDPLIPIQHENYWGNVNPIGLRATYDEGKRCAETLFMDYYRQFNIKIKIIRIFNTYGPKMAVNDGRVVSNFIVQALKNENITIYGDGIQTRSFQYIDDLINGMIKMMEADDSITGPINIGNPHEFTIIELAEKIINMTNSKSKLLFMDLPSDDPRQRKPNIDLAKEKLNWEPKIQIEEGLIKTIEYFDKILSASDNRILEKRQ